MSALEYSQSESSMPAVPEQSEPNGLTLVDFAAGVYNRGLILLTLYVLSIGPSFWLWVDSMYLEGPPAIATFYFPLLLLCEWIPLFGDLVNWYIQLWWS